MLLLEMMRTVTGRPQLHRLLKTSKRNRNSKLYLLVFEQADNCKYVFEIKVIKCIHIALNKLEVDKLTDITNS